MNVADRIRVQHMLDAAAEAMTFLQGWTQEGLRSNRMLLLSLVKEIEIIGEAATQVSRIPGIAAQGQDKVFCFDSSTHICVTLNIVELRNITFSLPADLIRKTRIYAAQHDTSMNTVVCELLEQAISREDRAGAAGKRLLNLAKRGPYFTTDPGSIRREDLYERGR